MIPGRHSAGGGGSTAHRIIITSPGREINLRFMETAGLDSSDRGTVRGATGKVRKSPPLSFHGNLRDTHGRLIRGIGRRCRHRSRCKGDPVPGPFPPTRQEFRNDHPGGIHGPRLRSFVRWRREAHRILSDPILASVPDGSLEFMNLSEDSGGIFKKNSHDRFVRASAAFHPDKIPSSIPLRTNFSNSSMVRCDRPISSSEYRWDGPIGSSDPVQSANRCRTVV